RESLHRERRRARLHIGRGLTRLPSHVGVAVGPRDAQLGTVDDRQPQSEPWGRDNAIGIRCDAHVASIAQYEYFEYAGHRMNDPVLRDAALLVKRNLLVALVVG